MRRGIVGAENILELRRKTQSKRLQIIVITKLYDYCLCTNNQQLVIESRWNVRSKELWIINFDDEASKQPRSLITGITKDFQRKLCQHVLDCISLSHVLPSAVYRFNSYFDVNSDFSHGSLIVKCADQQEWSHFSSAGGNVPTKVVSWSKLEWLQRLLF